ncbi:MAG: hypothetical protein LOD92_08405 [Bacillales bacterium]
MLKKGVLRKVAVDMTLIQAKWAAWFIGIVFAIYVLFRIFTPNVEVHSVSMETHSFLTMAYSPSKVFMLVLGILSVSSFLPFYVQHGVTRRDYFYGASFSSTVLTAGLMAIAWLVTIIEQVIRPDMINPSFLGPDASWLLTAFIFTLVILAYFAGGWLIGAGFYRYGAGGLLFILLAILFISFVESLWEFKQTHFLLLYFNFSDEQIPMSVSLLGTIATIIVSFLIVRLMTKRVRIKIK